MSNGHKTTSNTLTAVFGKDDLEEKEVEGFNDLLDDNSGLPQGVPLGMESNTKDLKNHMFDSSVLEEREHVATKDCLEMMADNKSMSAVD